MTTISDSSAFKDRGRLLPQHQAALTLLQSRLSTPSVSRLAWLDLACGRGQIIASLDTNLSPEARAKIAFWAYDLDQRYARETKKAADRLGLLSLQVTVGELSEFDRILPQGPRFDFITLTNTVHEVEPASLAAVLGACLVRLADSGTLFIYDMDSIRPPELGAVPWTRDDVRRIVRRMLGGLGCSTYHPEVGLWNHRTCNGWNLQLDRQHLALSPDEVTRRIEDAVRDTGRLIADLLRERLANCRTSLQTLTMYGAETAEEQEEKEQLLYEFWALNRALEQDS